jgi:NAD(P)-dependent dehydrogenase (short-subunit alcohol dehydrogenase family)
MNKKVIVTGSKNGLGKAIADALGAAGWDVVDWDIVDGFDVARPDVAALPEKLDALINCAGINSQDWLKDVKERDWDAVMNTNVKGIFKMVQCCEPLLRASKGTVINIVSNAAHMPMRCSAAYNASKGAALILTKQLARELSPDVTVFSISPNKIADTKMSEYIDEQVVRTRGWTKEQAHKYQVSSLLTGEETPANCIAEFISFLLSDKTRHKYLAGCDIPYGA